MVEEEVQLTAGKAKLELFAYVKSFIASSPVITPLGTISFKVFGILNCFHVLSIFPLVLGERYSALSKKSLHPWNDNINIVTSVSYITECSVTDIQDEYIFILFDLIITSIHTNLQ